MLWLAFPRAALSLILIDYRVVQNSPEKYVKNIIFVNVLSAEYRQFRVGGRVSACGLWCVRWAWVTPSGASMSAGPGLPCSRRKAWC